MEGIKTDQVAESLTALGCDTGQGCLIARPVPAPDLLRWLQHDGGRQVRAVPGTSVR